MDFSGRDLCVPFPDAIWFDWWKIRDLLLGHQCVRQDVSRAIALARRCSHPDAMWLSSLFANNNVSAEAAKKVFLQHSHDPRALCFAYAIWRNKDEEWLHNSASSGFAFAQVLLAGRRSLNERFALIQAAANQGERDAFSILGDWYQDEAKNAAMAKKCYLTGTALGDISAMNAYAATCRMNDPERWIVLGEAVRRVSMFIYYLLFVLFVLFCFCFVLFCFVLFLFCFCFVCLFVCFVLFCFVLFLFCFCFVFVLFLFCFESKTSRAMLSGCWKIFPSKLRCTMTDVVIASFCLRLAELLMDTLTSLIEKFLEIVSNSFSCTVLRHKQEIFTRTN